nr:MULTISPECIES: PDZ domain-containing protein [Microbacterium]
MFDPTVTVTPAPRRRVPRSVTIGIWALAVALLALLALTLLPTSFVIQRPGPVFNTLGTAADAEGEQVPLIEVAGADTYPTAGALDLLTAEIRGNPANTPSWVELAFAWFDPSRAILPIDRVFAEGQTAEERTQQSAQMMVDSQKEATAAALIELGHDVEPMVRVYAIGEESPAQGILQPDDIIRAVDGTPVDDTDALRKGINATGGDPVDLTVERDGQLLDAQVTPIEGEIDGETTWLVGVTTLRDFDFPIDVTIQLNAVGGSSAGMMFSLGIIDMLTPGELNGGESVAGTGTIDSEGVVGPIGAIRQKLHGAKDAGADWFLAPLSNCDEVVGHVPSGLQVFAVETLDDALEVLETIREDGDVDALPTCER